MPTLFFRIGYQYRLNPILNETVTPNKFINLSSEVNEYLEQTSIDVRLWIPMYFLYELDPSSSRRFQSCADFGALIFQEEEDLFTFNLRFGGHSLTHNDEILIYLENLIINRIYATIDSSPAFIRFPCPRGKIYTEGNHIITKARRSHRPKKSGPFSKETIQRIMTDHEKYLEWRYKQSINLDDLPT